MATNVFVDRDRCLGCSVCTRECPEIFEVKKDPGHNNDYKSFVRETADTSAVAEKIKQAVKKCPAHCISFEDINETNPAEVQGSAQEIAAQKKNLKVVLCTVPQNPNDSRESGETPIVPKIAIMTLTNWMDKHGYESDFFDIDMVLPPDDKIAEYFKTKKPDVVGISAVVSTSYKQVKKLAKIIRDASPNTWIVLGGYLAASSNVLLRKTEVDVCVLGDGEKTLVELLDYIQTHPRKDISGFQKIKGLAFINAQGELELTGYGEPILGKEVSFCDYDVLAKGILGNPGFTEKAYYRDGQACTFLYHDKRTFEPHRKPKMALIWTSKGCVARCAFCQRFSANYTTFDLEKMDKHLAELKEKHDVQFIFIADENFGSNKEYAYELAKMLKKYDMLWFCGGVRCTSFNKDDMKFFREMGCTSIKFGVESGSQKILDIMEKCFRKENVFAALTAAENLGLYSPLGMCVAMPGETNETIMETGKFVGEIARMQEVPPSEITYGIFYALPLPGTPLYEYAQLQGAIGTTPEEEEDYLLFVSDKNPNKMNYTINLTGKPMREVLFWDFLILYEAMREFYRAPIEKKNSSPHKHNTNLPYVEGGQKEIKKPIIINAIKSLTLKSMARYIASPATYLNRLLVRNKFVTKIPRPVFYGIMRILLYFEYGIHLLTGYRKTFGNKKQVPELKEAESLRVINQRIRAALPAPQTLTEKNRIVLLMGR